IFVHINHEYIPRFYILEHVSARRLEDAPNELSTGLTPLATSSTCTIPETKFIAVSEFHNPEVAQIKMRQNSLFAGPRNHDTGSTSTLRPS
uniref:T-box domain-containing protein n=1 Tax=Mesocestoides corti TaxID=53468 RepID=A0A5K3G197_MESCO